jgi:hypothetical protein
MYKLRSFLCLEAEHKSANKVGDRESNKFHALSDHLTNSADKTGEFL